jgi:hypothetical protein
LEVSSVYFPPLFKAEFKELTASSASIPAVAKP